MSVVLAAVVILGTAEVGDFASAGGEAFALGSGGAKEESREDYGLHFDHGSNVNVRFQSTERKIMTKHSLVVMGGFC